MSPEEIQLVERLALSLEAGLTAGQALQSVQIGPGDHLPNAVARGIEISRKYGSSLLPALRQLIEQARTENSIQEELASEFVAPQATIRLVGWLPVVAVALAMVSGFDVLASLKQPVAFISILVGIVLVWVAKRWSHRILHGAMPQPNEHLQALRDFLLALSSGLTVRQARDELKTSTPVLELVAEEVGVLEPVEAGRRLPEGQQLHGTDAVPPHRSEQIEGLRGIRLELGGHGGITSCEFLDTYILRFIVRQS